MRQTQIQSLGSGQGPIQCAGVGAQAIGQPGVEVAGVGVAQQGVESVPCTLGLGLQQEPVVAGGADAVIADDGLEVPGVGEDAKSATERVALHGIAAVRAGVRVIDVFVDLANQNVSAAGTGIACRHHDVSWHLTLNVEVELLHDALFEIAVLRLNGSAVIAGAHGRGIERTVLGKGRALVQKTILQTAIGAAERSTDAGGEKYSCKVIGIHFGIVGRVLPQALSALIPGRIVVNGIAGANHGPIDAEWLPHQTDARF